MTTTPTKLIVVHGWGGSLYSAVHALLRLDRFDVLWNDGGFFTDKHTGTVLRRILEHSDPDPLYHALQKLIIARFLEATPPPRGKTVEDLIPQALRFSEVKICQDFGYLGLPILSSARKRRASQLRQVGQGQLDLLLPILNELTHDDHDHSLLTTEAQARKHAFDASKTVFLDDSFVRLLQDIRDMHEVGGDLDTVASAVMYTHALKCEARKNNRRFNYGSEYRYVFVNYHEGIRHLAHFAPAEIYMADLPIGALPDFDREIRDLADNRVRLVRFEDHHPYTQSQLDALKHLQKDGLLEFFELAGALEGRELETEELRCGTDIVYDNLIKNTAADGDGPRRLQKAAHSEDFVCGTTRLGSILTELIKGGFCKTELVQVLSDALPDDSIEKALDIRKWDRLADEWRHAVKETEDRLLNSVYRLELKRPPGTLAELGGKALGSGSDVPQPQPQSKPAADDAGDKTPPASEASTTTVLVALAPAREADTPSIPVGKAAEFFHRTIPDADYLFYCYGANMMVARRLNQADLTFNLGKLMPLIGGDGDGGHAGAAVCRPENNPDYPKRLLSHVSRQTFGRFVHYLEDRLQQLDFSLEKTRDISRNAAAGIHEGGRKVLLITAAAILVGLGLLLLNAFRTDAVETTNTTFLPQINENNP